MLRWRAPFHAQRSTTTPALKMACRLASVPVLTVSVLKRLQDLVPYSLQLIFLFFYKKMGCERHLSRSSGLGLNKSPLRFLSPFTALAQRYGFAPYSLFTALVRATPEEFHCQYTAAE
jgi:hypothetical protein